MTYILTRRLCAIRIVGRPVVPTVLLARVLAHVEEVSIKEGQMGNTLATGNFKHPLESPWEVGKEGIKWGKDETTEQLGDHSAHSPSTTGTKQILVT